MDRQLAKQLLQFITKVAAYEGTTVDEIMKQPGAPTTQPDDAAVEGLKFYEDLLKLLKPEKAPHIPYINIDEEEEDERQKMLDKILEDIK